MCPPEYAELEGGKSRNLNHTELAGPCYASSSVVEAGQALYREGEGETSSGGTSSSGEGGRRSRGGRSRGSGNNSSSESSGRGTGGRPPPCPLPDPLLPDALHRPPVPPSPYHRPPPGIPPPEDPGLPPMPPLRGPSSYQVINTTLNILLKAYQYTFNLQSKIIFRL